MGKTYNDTPENFAEIEPYVITNPEEITREIILTERCYFYDTCAFCNHMRVLKQEYIYDYIKQSGGIVIVTRCIIMELCSNDNKLWKEHIQYIKGMSRFGIKVLVIYEEDVIGVLGACYSGAATINSMLSFAVKNAKSKAGTIEAVLNRNTSLKKELLIDTENKDSSLARRFFKEVRENKTSEDNLGEELIAVCVHLLANIREIVSFKYIVLTDDKGAITLLSKTMQNVEKHIKRKCISGVTTTKLCWLMFESNVISEKEQVKAIVAAGNAGNSIKVYSSEKYELIPSEKTMSIEEFAEELINNCGMKVYL